MSNKTKRPFWCCYFELIYFILVLYSVLFCFWSQHQISYKTCRPPFFFKSWNEHSHTGETFLSPSIVWITSSHFSSCCRCQWSVKDLEEILNKTQPSIFQSVPCTLTPIIQNIPFHDLTAISQAFICFKGSLLVLSVRQRLETRRGQRNI